MKHKPMLKEVLRPGVFVDWSGKPTIVIDEDPVLLAKTATAMHQVVLSDWIASGMKAPPEAVVQRAKDLVRKTLFRR